MRGEKGTIKVYSHEQLMKSILVYRARECKLKVRKLPRGREVIYEIKVDCPRPMSKAFRELLQAYVV